MKAYHRVFFYAITVILAGCSSQPESVSSVVPRTAYLAIPNVASSVERLNAVVQLSANGNITAKVAGGSRMSPRSFSVRVSDVRQSVSLAGGAPQLMPVVKLEGMMPGRYVVQLEGVGGDEGVTLFKGDDEIEIKSVPASVTPSSIRLLSDMGVDGVIPVSLERAVGTVTVNAALPADAADMKFTARIADAIVPLDVRGSELHGVLGDVATGLNQVLLVEGTDASSEVVYQGANTIAIRDGTPITTSVTMNSLPMASSIAVLKSFDVPDKGFTGQAVPVQFEARSGDGGSLGQVTFYWGDGTKTDITTPESATILTPQHTYTSVGIQALTACVTSPRGLMMCTHRLLNVVDASGAAYQGKYGLLQLDFSNAPLYATEVSVTLDPQQGNIGRQRDVQPKRIVTLRREGLRSWIGSVRLRRGLTYGLNTNLNLGGFRAQETVSERRTVTLDNQLQSKAVVLSNASVDLNQLDTSVRFPGLMQHLRIARVPFRTAKDLTGVAQIATEFERKPVTRSSGLSQTLLSETELNFAFLENAQGELLAMDFVSARKPFFAFAKRNNALAFVLSELTLRYRLEVTDAMLESILKHPKFFQLLTALDRDQLVVLTDSEKEWVADIVATVKPPTPPVDAQTTPNSTAKYLTKV